LASFRVFNETIISRACIDLLSAHGIVDWVLQGRPSAKKQLHKNLSYAGVPGEPGK